MFQFRNGILFFLLSLGFFSDAHPVIFKNGWVYWGTFRSSQQLQKVSYTFHPSFSLESSAFNSKLLISEWPLSTSKQIQKFLSKRKLSKLPITQEYQNYQIGLNVLVKRWLFEQSQANIYTALKFGYYRYFFCQFDQKYVHSDFLLCSSLQKEKSKVSLPIKGSNLLTQFSIFSDWESRRLYTALHFRINYHSDLLSANGDFFHAVPTIHTYIRYRLGFAPYVASMTELQTWFVLQFNHFQQMVIKDIKTKSLLSNFTENWKISPILRFFYHNVLWELGSDLKSDFFVTLMVHY